MPFLETVQMEDMGTLSPDLKMAVREREEVSEELTEWAVISRDLASRTAAVVGDATDTTEVVQVVPVLFTALFPNIPMPLSNCVPILDRHLHPVGTDFHRPRVWLCGRVVCGKRPRSVVSLCRALDVSLHLSLARECN
jgi:hypothetical protein